VIDTAKVNRPVGTRKPRFRIYGNLFLLNEMAEIIAANVGVKVMKLQKVSSNDITKTLCYQGKSAVYVCQWLGIKRKEYREHV
jgi:hypothetical protein